MFCTRKKSIFSLFNYYVADVVIFLVLVNDKLRASCSKSFDVVTNNVIDINTMNNFKKRGTARHTSE